MSAYDDLTPPPCPVHPPAHEGCFAVWVLESSSIAAGREGDDPQDWVDVLEHIFWTRNAAFAYLQHRYLGPERFAALWWQQPYPNNPDYYHAGHPTVATRRWIVRKKYIL